MEQGGGVGSTPSAGAGGGTAPAEAEASAAPAAPEAAQPQGGMALAATEVQDGGQAEPGKEKAAGEAGGRKAEPAGEAAPAAPDPQDGGQAAPAEEASAAQHDGGQAASTEKVPAATKAQDGGKDEPVKEKTPTGEEPKGGQPVPVEGKTLAVAGAQDGGKDEPMKEQGPGRSEVEGCGKTESAEKAPSAVEAEGGKAKPTEETTLATAQAQDGGKEVPAKEKPMAAAKAQDGGKKAVKAEKTPADKKPEKEKASGAAKAQDKLKKVANEEKAPAAKKAQTGGKEEPAKDKTMAAVKAQDGGKKAANVEKTPADKKPEKEKASGAAKAQDKLKKVANEEKAPAAKKAQTGGKEEPAKDKTMAAVKAQDGGKKAANIEKTPADKKPEKEKASGAAKAQDKENKVEKAEKAPAAKKAQTGGKEEPAKDKTMAAVKAQDGGKKAARVEPPPAAAEAGGGGEEPAEAAAMAAAKAQGEGENVAKAEEMDQQQPRGPEPPRPVLLQSLSCPAACQREEQPWEDPAVMETILEETVAVERREGPTEPGPAPAALGDPQPRGSSPGTPQGGTLPSAAGKPPDPTGAIEQPGPGGQPSSPEAEPPPSPYLTPDFGKEDPFEILDDIPPPPAPFTHRIVTLRSASVSSQFNLSSKDILGGGKFGEVHTCTEKQTGLKLAAKVIRKQGAKDKEMVLLEIDVMNQLNHRNLIQLYDAIETPREIILFMEFVEGGELFERIIDDDYHLTEVDCMVFVRQICEGIRFMHHMGVLHLDLKPENILCVAATGHMVKIIDFGLARRYNPQDKLKVNFGTPEFLSPEVVNYEQVSYSTDMWSMGVITYMLLSGLSPFLGDNDTETLNNVLAANWYFDEETFESVSDEAKDFVSNLIIKEKSARMSAGQCLQHPWLNNLAEKAKRCNRQLKSQVLLKKYVMRRRWKKNFIGVCAANRFKKITSSGSLTALGV
ncbi:myosin light chain kinase 2, skeletal/cardiac muscle [Falco naumanni]|uniref:myosin light chain kinase 2, skeletal/cardiac muscle n=1 Tax=Falco naumanni TaxID=148594 RepID=UPI001ADE0FEA|nr:myosin light chain kinase 2, skeletal/cardiac muscle [Falco naumanni]